MRGKMGGVSIGSSSSSDSKRDGGTLQPLIIGPTGKGGGGGGGGGGAAIGSNGGAVSKANTNASGGPNPPAGQSFSSSLRTALLPLGAVPYDGFLLPLVSPDGRRIATQIGAAPDWDVTLAERTAQPPTTTIVETYSLDVRDNVRPEDRTPPQKLAQVNQPVVLGRSCDADGYLVEAPQADGARWIGKAAWDTGEITWLVQSSAVNAFAAMSGDGRLAWCRRDLNADRFDLVVREADGSEWSIPGNGGDWSMPVWASAGDGLYALYRKNNRLDVCFGVPGNPRMFIASRKDFTLFANSDRYAAYQTFIGQGSLDGSTARGEPTAFLFHPRLGSMMIWRPLANGDRAAVQLNARSLAAQQHNSEAALVSLRDKLILQSLRHPDLDVVVTRGTWVPRRTPDWNYEYVLLSPGEGWIQIVALRMLGLAEQPPALPSGSR